MRWILACAGMSGGRKLSPMIEPPAVLDLGKSACPEAKAAAVRTIAEQDGVLDWAAFNPTVQP